MNENENKLEKQPQRTNESSVDVSVPMDEQPETQVSSPAPEEQADATTQASAGISAEETPVEAPSAEAPAAEVSTETPPAESVEASAEAPAPESPSPEASAQKNESEPPVTPPTFGSTAPPVPPVPPVGSIYAQPMRASNTPPAGYPYTPPMGGPRPIAPPPPAATYRWTYADQKAHDGAENKKRRSRGLLIYALVMTGVFALSFGLLLGTMLMKGGEFPTIQFSESVTNENGEIIPTTDYADAVNIEKAKQSVVLIEVTTPDGGGSGTGIILSEDGYIATNHHVIEDGTSIRVKFYDGSYATAYVRGSSAVDDLAVIKVDRTRLTPATFAHSSDCFVGQTVYAIGNPSGAEMAWTTTKGCISFVDRELKIYKDDGTLEKKLKMIQTDAMVNPGNSGGPLVNTKGEVVGIVSMKLADGYEGIGFAIPSDGASEILNAIIRDGNADNVNSNVSYERPVIGITGVYMEGGRHYVFEEDKIAEVTESYAEENPDMVISPAVSGIYVSALTEGMDAAGKLMVGDIITAINGVEATNMNVLMNEINEHYVGDDVVVTYYRNTIYTDVTITLCAATE